VLVSIVCGALSPFVVLRRMAFVGHGVAHAAFGGVALGVLLGFNPILSGAGFAIGVALLIGVVGRRGRLSEDASIGILFASAMAFGVVCLNLMKGYAVDLFGYLFGNLLAVTPADLGLIVALAVVTVVLLLLFSKEFLFLALTVVISIKVVGAVLIAALLVIPGASALQLSSSYRVVFPLSVGLGVLAALGGMAVSYFADLPPGATVVLSSSALFGVCLAAGRAWR
jgi:ABC-type Mn2+/Zn2+ transport system permease subunit